MKIACLLAVLLVAGGCISSDPLAYRMMADYLPIANRGSWWRYTDEDGVGMYLEVTGDSVVLNRACKVLQRDYAEEFWYRGEGEVAVYARAVLEVNAEEIVVEERWRPWLELPLILGNSWTDTFRKETVALGDTIRREVEISGAVLSRETVSVPAGEFEQCYRVELLLTELTRSEVLGETSERTVIKQWYGGDVGLLRLQQGGKVWELEDYEVK